MISSIFLLEISVRREQNGKGIEKEYLNHLRKPKSEKTRILINRKGLGTLMMMKTIYHFCRELGMPPSSTTSTCPKFQSMMGEAILQSISTASKLYKPKRNHPAMKNRAFHLTLSGAAKAWYTRLLEKCARTWPNFIKAFLKCFATIKGGE